LLLPLAHRPLKDLIQQVAAGFSYNPVSFTDVAAYQLQQQTGQVSTTPLRDFTHCRFFTYA
jgi:hypothetical protein